MEQSRIEDFDLSHIDSEESIRRKIKRIFGEEILDDIKLDSLRKEKDIFSTIYEKVLDKKKRKQYAQFFTHRELVQFLAEKIPIQKTNRILDPACGAGAFLSYLKNQKRIPLHNLYGIDIDETALDICRTNLSNSSKNDNLNLVNANTLLNSSLEQLFPDVYDMGGFDVIIGNPPFQNLRKGVDFLEDESIYSEVIYGIVNSSSLMIAKGYEFLKRGGYLGFVLPKNILRVDSFKRLRRFLLNNTRLLHIYDINHYFKDVRGDQVLLAFQKDALGFEEMKSHDVELYIYKKGNEFNSPYRYQITQGVFFEYKSFPVFYHKDVFHLAQKFKTIKTNLEDVSNKRIFRGLGISMNSGLIIDERNNQQLTVYRGDSIAPFAIKYPLFIDKKSLAQVSENKIRRLAQDKIILQNIFSKEGGIFATLSTKEELSLDTVTNVVVKSSLLKYCLGILNSIIANFYMIFIVFLNSNFTMHADRTYIGRIPIKLPTIKEKITIEKLVDRLLQIDDATSLEFQESYEELNDRLLDIYGMTDCERKNIIQLTNEVMSRKYNG